MFAPTVNVNSAGTSQLLSSFNVYIEVKVFLIHHLQHLSSLRFIWFSSRLNELFLEKQSVRVRSFIRSHGHCRTIVRSKPLCAHVGTSNCGFKTKIWCFSWVLGCESPNSSKGRKHCFRSLTHSFFKKLPRRNVEGPRNSVNVVDRHVLLGAFNRANICAVQICLVRQLLLRPALFSSGLSHVSRERIPQRAFGRSFHTR